MSALEFRLYCAAQALTSITRSQKRRRKEHFDVDREVQRAEYSHIKRPIDPKTKKHLEPAHKFEVSVESDSISQSKYDVFLRYQSAIHKDGDEWTKSRFKNFLCNGMPRRTEHADSRAKKLGSYHQCYRLDGKLIAIGVLDLLPHGVSSVYLFYDPEFEQWGFGKVSALHEIVLAQQMDYKYYYMGYYIHSCPKMRYKGTFSPQYVLDPEELTWLRLSPKILKALDTKTYVSFTREGLTDGSDSSPAALTSSSEGPTTAATDMELHAHNGTPNAYIDRNNSNTIMDLDDDGDEDDLEYPSGSLFSYHIPGVMTLPQLLSRSQSSPSPIDLSTWSLLINNNTLVSFEDLRGWEAMSATDPMSVKGIVAELAAVLGPEVAGGGRRSGVVLF
ncbi:MAG: hypothetical protein Q9227_000917 [Pyrenula ochraceoflavens]